MAIKNNKLGGTDWGEEALKPTVDLNPTINALIDFAGKGLAQQTYQTIKQSGSFTNEDFLGADRFTDSNGVNNTINTGSSTAFYTAGDDRYKIATETDNIESDSPGAGSDNYKSTYTITGTIDSSQGYFSKVRFFVRDTGSRTATVTIKKGATTIASESGISCPTQAKYTSNYTAADFSELFESGDTFSVVITLTASDLVTQIESHSGTYFSYTSQFANTSGSNLTFQEYLTNTSGTVIADSGTKTLDGTETSIIIYPKITHTANTSMTVDISDGTTTLSAQSLNEVINISSLSSGTLKLTFNLATTDTTETPEFEGYGFYII